MGMKCFSLGMRKKPRSSSSSPASSSSSPASSLHHVSSPSLCAAAAHQVHQPGNLRQLFEDFDADGDGRISSADLESLLSRLGGANAGSGSPDPAGDAASMVQAADLDGDGYISLEEFVSVCGGDESPRAEDLRSAFAVYDRDGDGMISAEELHQVLSGVMGERAATMAECEGMIRAVDCNGDGAVSFDEFERMMTRSLLA